MTDKTIQFSIKEDHEKEMKSILKAVYNALSEKGYNPTDFALVAFGACQSSMKGLVGADRDDHGCIASAGYTWSYALHDCIRVWEQGHILSYGGQTAGLVFSADSVYAEVFCHDGRRVICRRKKGQTLWTARNTGENVFVRNGVLTAELTEGVFTKE